MSWLDHFIMERDKLNDRVAMAGHHKIKDHLNLLNERYSRHTFKFVQGMGMDFVMVNPPMRHCDIIDNISGLDDVIVRIPFLSEHYSAIKEIANNVYDEFDRMEIGDVQ